MCKKRINKGDSFPSLREFLKTERDATEYNLSKVTSISTPKWEPKATNTSKCWVHPESNSHSIENCNRILETVVATPK